MKKFINGIEVDYSKDSLITETGHALMRESGYLFGEEKSPQEALIRCSNTFGDNKEHSKRLYKHFSNQWAFPATPVLSNGGTERGLTISCFVSKYGDSLESIADHYAENMFMAVRGGGIGSDMTSLRSLNTPTSKGNHSPGVIPFCRVIDSQVLASIQGSTRRGAGAVYLSVDHPEIEEFIDIRRPTGDANRRSVNLNNAVTIPDSFMMAVEHNIPWNLIDPHTRKTVKTVDARDLWMKILKARMETGEPYLFWIDTANAALNPHLKEQGFKINSSNLCNEIMLPTSPDRTAVCCLSSVNLAKFDEWKNDDLFIEDMLRFLDNVLQDFIDKADPHLWRAKESAQKERSVGLGAMGFHSFLQSKGVPFEGAMATSWNKKIFNHLREQIDAANEKLGKEKGSPEDLEDTGLRFAHTQALAPNARISILCGETSPSIEPWSANAFVQKTDAGAFLVKNKHLDKLLLTKYGHEECTPCYEKVWQSIITHEGSVQHFKFMDDEDKEVFKTAPEIDQEWIIEHAAVRQPFIDQGQSVNLFIPPEVSKGYLHNLHKQAWKKGLKGLYYCRTMSVGKTDVISKDISKNSGECLSCEG